MCIRDRCWFALPAVQFCGYISEILYSNDRGVDAAASRYTRNLKWYVFALGGVIHSGVFTVIAMGVISNRGNEVVIDDTGTLGEFDGWGLQSGFYFASYIVFPIIAALYLANKIQHFWFAEICYIRFGLRICLCSVRVLTPPASCSASLTAKTSMFWLIISTT